MNRIAIAQKQFPGVSYFEPGKIDQLELIIMSKHPKDSFVGADCVFHSGLKFK
jgi:hypothetical protein